MSVMLPNINNRPYNLSTYGYPKNLSFLKGINFVDLYDPEKFKSQKDCSIQATNRLTQSSSESRVGLQEFFSHRVVPHKAVIPSVTTRLGTRSISTLPRQNIINLENRLMSPSMKSRQVKHLLSKYPEFRRIITQSDLIVQFYANETPFTDGGYIKKIYDIICCDESYFNINEDIFYWIFPSYNNASKYPPLTHHNVKFITNTPSMFSLYFKFVDFFLSYYGMTRIDNENIVNTFKSEERFYRLNRSRKHHIRIKIILQSLVDFLLEKLAFNIMKNLGREIVCHGGITYFSEYFFSILVPLVPSTRYWLKIDRSQLKYHLTDQYHRL